MFNHAMLFIIELYSRDNIFPIYILYLLFLSQNFFAYIIVTFFIFDDQLVTNNN